MASVASPDEQKVKEAPSPPKKQENNFQEIPTIPPPKPGPPPSSDRNEPRVRPRVHGGSSDSIKLPDLDKIEAIPDLPSPMGSPEHGPNRDDSFFQDAFATSKGSSPGKQPQPYEFQRNEEKDKVIPSESAVIASSDLPPMQSASNKGLLSQKGGKSSKSKSKSSSKALRIKSASPMEMMIQSSASRGDVSLRNSGKADSSSEDDEKERDSLLPPPASSEEEEAEKRQKKGGIEKLFGKFGGGLSSNIDDKGDIYYTVPSDVDDDDDDIYVSLIP